MFGIKVASLTRCSDYEKTHSDIKHILHEEKNNIETLWYRKNTSFSRTEETLVVPDRIFSN